MQKETLVVSAALMLRQSVNQLRRHLAQALLALLGITLGVAVVVGIDLATASAQRSLDLSIGEVVGTATHHIVGGPTGIDESLYAQLRVHHGLYPLAPVIDAQVTLDGKPGGIRWLGIDPLAESSFREHGRPPANAAVPDWFVPLMSERGTVLLARSTAASLDLKLGEAVYVVYRGARHGLRLVGWLDNAEEPDAGRYGDLMLSDIATAQEVLGMAGRITRIDIRARAEEAARIRRLLPPAAELIDSAQQGDALRQMTRAFSTQLQALSLLAVLVGIFLIYNTETFLVLQRREVLGVLRALGVTRAEVFMLILGEALCLAVIGTALGVLAGIVLGNGLTRLVARTINDHYYALSVHGLALPPWLFAKGAAVGILSTLLAAAAPASEAARATPSVAMRRITAEAAAGALIRATTLGGLCMLLAAVPVLLAPGTMAWAFFGLALLVLGCTALTPAACRALLQFCAEPIARLFGWRGELATRGLRRSLSRTAPALTALTLAVATTVGIGLMIHSFRGAVDAWLAQLLRADLYVSASEGDQPLQPLPESLEERIRALPLVAAISTSRRLVLESADNRRQLIVYQLAPQSRPGFRFLAGGGEAGWASFERDDAVLVSEPYAAHHHLVVGDIVRLRTDRGSRPFAVVGIYRDYGSDRGTIAISRATYNRHFHDRAITGIGIYGHAGVTRADLSRSVQSITGSFPQVSVNTRMALRRASLEIFERTFTITEVLRVIASLIAFIGVTGSLLALQLERRHEYGVLRALGVTPRELAGVVVAQAGIMGLLAGALSMPAGVGMAAALVYVINVRAFGWSMDLHSDPFMLLQGLLLATVAALAAGIGGAVAASRLPPAQCLRQE